ncbi:hypothetical protein DU54_11290 [Methanosarcina mazei]|jgi:hypothetical protein|uniref:Uncharacterized protein n=1 Tax=Methanosarcina mazei TaxID=2209 RepID=A0A0F8EE15_METMZ|nr:hypothetical protein DU47_14175 [Methanosarcina mazei]KKG37976.1 hypothetical protein DU30_14625 [Methanosarcina mazei]KKG69566.1 hypothetical protein DU43_01205 [Methanosarcina mazei]KKG76710.1 hypothetical protein DU55_12970 [Methanosarcina mazei]KKG99240.1 hypothetical protein DU56_13825 [Methanosarcina mazei]
MFQFYYFLRRENFSPENFLSENFLSENFLSENFLSENFLSEIFALYSLQLSMSTFVNVYLVATIEVSQ